MIMLNESPIGQVKMQALRPPANQSGTYVIVVMGTVTGIATAITAESTKS
jgi:hypothetical protein